jgi:hypothetical protein
MEKSPRQNDKCPHCQILFEIVSVKIGLARVTMQSICPNCSLVQEDPDKKNRSKRRGRGPISFLGKRR